MKVNILNTTKRFTSFFTAVIVFVATLCIPAFAVDSYGNEFIDIDDYAKYSFAESNTYVDVSLNLPSSWNFTYVYGYDYRPRIGGFNGNYFEFDTTEQYASFFLHPLGGRDISVGAHSGEKLREAHFIELAQLPSNTSLFYTFSITVSDDLQAENVFINSYSILCYVDKDGVCLGSFHKRMNPEITVNEDESSILKFSYSVNLSGLNVPDNTVGILPLFTVPNLPYVYGRTTAVTLGSFSLYYPLSSLQYESMQNDKLQNTMDSVENALEEQGQKMDNILNGTPEQNEQVNGAVGDLNDKADDLGALGDQMASVEKPEINSKDFSADKLVPKTSLVVLSAPFHALWENNTLLAMLSIVVALVLVSWIFFGKKG